MSMATKDNKKKYSGLTNQQLKKANEEAFWRGEDVSGYQREMVARGLIDEVYGGELPQVTATAKYDYGKRITDAVKTVARDAKYVNGKAGDALKDAGKAAVNYVKEDPWQASLDVLSIPASAFGLDFITDGTQLVTDLARGNKTGAAMSLAALTIPGLTRLTNKAINKVAKEADEFRVIGRNQGVLARNTDDDQLRVIGSNNNRVSRDADDDTFRIIGGNHQVDPRPADDNTFRIIGRGNAEPQVTEHRIPSRMNRMADDENAVYAIGGNRNSEPQINELSEEQRRILDDVFRVNRVADDDEFRIIGGNRSSEPPVDDVHVIQREPEVPVQAEPTPPPSSVVNEVSTPESSLPIEAAPSNPIPALASDELERISRLGFRVSDDDAALLKRIYGAEDEETANAIIRENNDALLGMARNDFALPIGPSTLNRNIQNETGSRMTSDRYRRMDRLFENARIANSSAHDTNIAEVRFDRGTTSRINPETWGMDFNSPEPIDYRIDRLERNGMLSNDEAERLRESYNVPRRGDRPFQNTEILINDAWRTSSEGKSGVKLRSSDFRSQSTLENMDGSEARSLMDALRSDIGTIATDIKYSREFPDDYPYYNIPKAKENIRIVQNAINEGFPNAHIDINDFVNESGFFDENKMFNAFKERHNSNIIDEDGYVVEDLAKTIHPNLLAGYKNNNTEKTRRLREVMKQIDDPRNQGRLIERSGADFSVDSYPLILDGVAYGSRVRARNNMLPVKIEPLSSRNFRPDGRVAGNSMGNVVDDQGRRLGLNSGNPDYTAEDFRSIADRLGNINTKLLKLYRQAGDGVMEQETLNYLRSLNDNAIKNFDFENATLPNGSPITLSNGYAPWAIWDTNAGNRALYPGIQFRMRDGGRLNVFNPFMF